MTSRLHFHLGPVGGFVGEARRTRDYWAGSFILSRLIGEAMWTVEHEGGRILLPVLQQQTADGRIEWIDPTWEAIRTGKDGQRVADGPFLGTLTNHFTADFKRRDDAQRAAAAAAEALRRVWIGLADAVRRQVLGDFTFLADADRRKVVRDIWDAQIGTEAATPFWEIYWVVVPAPKHGSGDDPLERRKLTRFGEDACGRGPVGGNFCTMLPGLVDISGIERRLDPQLFKEFWEDARRHLNRRRYGEDKVDEKSCLDLRPNESLSAPALVKRLFPLLVRLAPGELRTAIDWVPDIRPATVLQYRETTLRRLRKLVARTGLTEPPAELPAAERDQRLDVQSALFWPSTSYIAATHWIARVQRSAPKLAVDFADAIETVGIQYAYAERSLWLRAVHEPFDDAPLAFIDGAMFHRNRLELVAADRRRIEKAVKLLNQIGDAPLKPVADPSFPARAGAAPDHYAIIRADGDHVGRALSAGSGTMRLAVSRMLNDFSNRLRGVQRDTATADERLGVVARRNGVILYAGADEVMAFAPVEDALDIAFAIREAFIAARDGVPSLPTGEDAEGVAKLTVSAAVLYVHIRTPLRWAIRQSADLLDGTAKKAAGRNALALALFDIDGLRSPFAAPWDGHPGTGHPGSAVNPLAAFRDLLTAAATEHGFLWSNEFYHRVTDRLAAFLVPERCNTFAEAVKFAAGGKAATPGPSDVDMVEAILRRAVAERAAGDGSGPPTAAIARLLLDAMTIVAPYPAECRPAGLGVWRGPVLPATLDILRVLGGNWCKDGDEGAPAAVTEDAA